MGSRRVRESGNSLATLKRRVEGFADGRLRQKVLGKIGAELAAAQREAFDSESSPQGVPWKPLKKPRTGKMLQISQRLKKSATRPVFRGNSVGFDLTVYAGRQNFGYPAGHTPARPFLALDPLPFEVRQRIDRAVSGVISVWMNG